MLNKLKILYEAILNRYELAKLIEESVQLARLPEGVATARINMIETRIKQIVKP